MLYTCAGDFFQYAATVKKISREEEKKLGLEMREGSEEAKEAIITSYLPVLASYLKRYSSNPGLELIYRGLDTLKDAVAHFNFQSENPTFSKFLGNQIKLMMAKYIADGSV